VWQHSDWDAIDEAIKLRDKLLLILIGPVATASGGIATMKLALERPP
jgi:hypothetical protein